MKNFITILLVSVVILFTLGGCGNPVSDDETAVVGTINLDYRSLAHHFENAIWMYKTDIVADIKKDFLDTQEKCERITLEKCMKKSFAKIIFLPILRLFSPMF